MFIYKVKQFFCVSNKLVNHYDSQVNQDMLTADHINFSFSAPTDMRFPSSAGKN